MNNIQIFTKIAILILTLFQIYHCQFSSLELANPLIVVPQPGSPDINIIYTISDKLLANTLICLASMKIIEGTTNPLSNLTDCHIVRQSNYVCFRLFNNGSGLTLSELNNITQKVPAFDNRDGIYWETITNISTSMNLTLNATLNSKPFEQIITVHQKDIANKIVRMVSCQIFNSITDECESIWKFNYIQLYTPQVPIMSNAPRHHACTIFNKKEIHIFHGGIIRQSINYMMIGVLVQDRDRKPINMWGGIGYSNDHASRDMFCYTSKGQTQDIISFISGAPYQDVNEYIQGTDDAFIAAISNSQPLFQDPSNHFIQYYRKYQTGDFSGDQDIIPRIYGVYSFAARFDENIDTQLSCLDANQKHSMVFLFSSYIDLAEVTLTSFNSLIFLITILMLEIIMK